MGSNEDPKDGGKVAVAVFGAVAVYGVCYPFSVPLSARRAADGSFPVFKEYRGRKWGGQLNAWTIYRSCPSSVWRCRSGDRFASWK